MLLGIFMFSSSPVASQEVTEPDDNTNTSTTTDENTSTPTNPGVITGAGGDTPLVIDWNQDGTFSTAMSKSLSPVLFDFSGAGNKTLVEWIAPEDRFLVLDLNRNNTIDSGKELFGDSTFNKLTGKKSADGFMALMQYDNNQDGVIDAKDRVFKRLMLWADYNSNGQSDAGELIYLKDTDIVSIALSYKTLAREHRLKIGPATEGFLTSEITYKSGKKGLIVDVIFKEIKSEIASKK
jgi:hypothetical protein